MFQNVSKKHDFFGRKVVFPETIDHKARRVSNIKMDQREPAAIHQEAAKISSVSGVLKGIDLQCLVLTPLQCVLRKEHP